MCTCPRRVRVLFLNGMKRLWVVLILILAFFGLADSAYLAQSALSGTSLLCNIQNLSGCNVVAASEYSRLFGIPLAIYGVVFYSAVFMLAALELALYNLLLRRALQVASVIGVLSSLYFVFVQKFFIGAFCIYCFVSAVIALLILVCASLIEPIRKLTGKDVQPPPFSKGQGTQAPAKATPSAQSNSGAAPRATLQMPPSP